MKKWLSKSHLMTFLMVMTFLYLQGPLILNNFSQKETKLISKKYKLIFSGEEGKEKFIIFPPQNPKIISIFWASWCSPCKIEMARLQSSVEKGKISKNHIFAINPFESPHIIEKFLSQHNYPFTFIEAPDIVSKLNIDSTPTTIFIDNGRVTSISSGLSLIGIWKAEFFL